MKDILIFVDDSGKIHNQNEKFVIFSAVVFSKKEEYDNFKITFKENFNKIVIKNLTYQEIKGKDFWKTMKEGKQHYGYSDEQRRTILKSIEIFQISVFSLILEKEELILPFDNHGALEEILDSLLIKLLEKIIDTLKFEEKNIHLEVDNKTLRVGLFESDFKKWWKNIYKQHRDFCNKIEELQITISDESNLKTNSKNSLGIQFADFIAYFINRELNKEIDLEEIKRKLNSYFDNHLYLSYFHEYE